LVFTQQAPFAQHTVYKKIIVQSKKIIELKRTLQEQQPHPRIWGGERLLSGIWLEDWMTFDDPSWLTVEIVWFNRLVELYSSKICFGGQHTCYKKRIVEWNKLSELKHTPQAQLGIGGDKWTLSDG
jgi:hypothetical protein